MIRCGLVGVTGRMGRAILRESRASAALRIAAGIASPGSAWTGRDLGELDGGPMLGIAVSADLQVLRSVDVVLDFSRAETGDAVLAACRALERPLLIGTTGHARGFDAQVQAAGADIPVMLAPNTSRAVTLLAELVRLTARALPSTFDIEILDAHHRAKRDAPSGTALMLGHAASEARAAGAGAGAGTVSHASLRGGDIVGEHTVLFAGEGEQLALLHRVTDRGIFARGALQAAAWLAAQPAGVRTMRDFVLSDQRLG